MALSKIKTNSITDNAVTTDQMADTAVHGRRNIIINGAMNVWQRGTSLTGLSSGNNYLVDRFYWKVTSFGTWRIDQSTDTPNESFKYSYKAECTTADTSIGVSDQLRLIHSIEGQDLVHLAYGSSAAKKTTLSFWIKSNKAATYAITLEAGGGRNYTVHYTVDTADTWEHKTVTINGDTTNVLGNQGNTAGITFSWWFGVGTAYDSDETQDAWYSDGDYSGLTGGVTTNLADTVGNDVYITGVQLEVGDKATPFEYRSYAEELMACRRYFWAMVAEGEATGGAGNTNQKVMGSGYYLGSSQVELPLVFPVEMRAAPTLSSSSGTNHFIIEAAGGNDGFDTWSQFASKKQSALLYRSNAVVSGTAGQSGRIIAASSSAYVYWSAEL